MFGLLTRSVTRTRSATYDARMRSLPLIACFASVALLAGCTSGASAPETSSPAPIESASEDTGEVAGAGVNAADVQPWTAGAVPGGNGSGVTYPDTWPSAVVTGSGTSTSLTPTLVAPQASGRVDVQVVSLTQGGGFGADGQGEATEVVFEGTADAERIEIPSGALAQGATYAWRVTENGDTWAGPWTFNVDTVRSQTAPTDDVNGIVVNLLSGLATVGWQSKSTAGANGPIQVSVMHRPGLPESPGLPAGWTWVLPGSGALRLVESQLTGGEGDDAGPLSVTLFSSTGAGTTYVRTTSGAYVPGLADGTATQYASGGVLSRVEPGVWQFMSSDGTVTRYQGGRPVAEWAGGVPIATYAWDDKGRLISVGDGVSRTMSMAYAGSGTCGADTWGNGFSTREGLWCALTNPDGSVTNVGYVGDQIGLIADTGGISAGFGWDGSGRLSAVRSSDAGSAAATAGWKGPETTTQISYDDRGRVASITTAAAQPDGQRTTRSYTYPVGADGGKLRASVQLTAGSGQGATILTVEAAQESWQVLSRTDATGRTATVKYDESSGALTQGTDVSGRSMAVDLDRDAMMTSSVGPYLGSTDSAMRTDRIMDATPTDPAAGADTSVKPWEGLAASIWTEDGVVSQWWDRSVLRVGNNRGVGATLDFPGNWTAQATGMWTITESGRYTIEATGSDNLSVTPVINGVQCTDDQGQAGCVIDLKKGQQSFSLVLRGKGAGSFDIRAGIDSPVSIDPTTLSPNYGSATVIKVNDEVKGRSLSTQVLGISQPWTGKPDTVTASGGLTTAYAYEPIDPGAGQWGRTLQMTTPGGSVQKQSYYGDEENATDPCSQGSYPQAGLPKTLTRYDGVQITIVYGPSGQPLSQTTVGQQDGAEVGERLCTTYDAAGRVLTSTLTDLAGTALSSTQSTYVWQDGRLVVTTVDRVKDTDYTTVAVQDILGRLVTYTDTWGNRSDFTYDAEGNNVVRRTVTPQGASAPVLDVEYAYDQFGSLSTVTVNGKEAASVSYAEDQLVRKVSYAGGVTRELEYDPSGALASVDLSTKGRSFTHRVIRNSAGRILSTDLSVDGGGKKATSSTWTYSYDDAGRLVDAKLDTSGDTTASGGEKRTFNYDYSPSQKCPSQAGKNLDRTGGSRDGVAFTTCYDDRGRLAWTSDPQLAPKDGKATASWDGLGRLTALDSVTPLSLTWAGSTQVASVTQGSSVATFVTASGLPIEQTVDGAVTRFGYDSPTASGPTLLTDESGAITEIRVDLPGGAQAVLDPQGALATLDHVDALGALLTTTSADGTATGVGEAALAPRYGPFGEPLTPDDALAPPASYRWQAEARNPSLGGAHDLTISARPYHPWLGQFLAFDPAAGAATTGYGYGAADPVNRPDVTGNWDVYDWMTVIGTTMAVIGGLSAGSVAGTTSKLALGVNKALKWGGALLAIGGVAGNVVQGGWDTSATISTAATALGIAALAYGQYNWNFNFTKKRYQLYEGAYKAEFDVKNSAKIKMRDNLKAKLDAFKKGGGDLLNVEVGAVKRLTDLQQELRSSYRDNLVDSIMKSAKDNGDSQFLRNLSDDAIINRLNRMLK